MVQKETISTFVYTNFNEQLTVKPLLLKQKLL